MIKIKILVNGNIAYWLQILFVIFGFAIMYLTYKFIKPSIWSGMLLVMGFGVAAVGGLSSRAATLKIKPFDNSYKKARKGYEVNDKNSDRF